jgi:hypothetical protein
VSLTSTSHGFQIGTTSGQNLRADNEEIQAVNNGVANTLRLNASGGQVHIGAGGLEVDGTATFDNTATFHPPQSSNSLALALNHGYGVYVDNVSVTGVPGFSRMWIETPDNGDVVIGPRAGAEAIATLRLRTDNVTSSAANMYIDPATYTVERSTSSLRYKVDVEDLVLDLDAVRALRPVRYRDKGDAASDPATMKTYAGLIAEEVDALGLDEFVHYWEDEESGERRPDGVQYERLVVAQHMLITELEDRVTAQDAQIAELLGRVAALEGGGA